MRCTLGSIGAAAAAILLAMAMWPVDARVQVPNRAVAQPGATPKPADAKVRPAPAKEAVVDSQAAVNAKLDKKLTKVDFEDVPLSDVLAFLSDATELDILVDKAWFSEYGLSLDVPIKLQVKHATVSARTLLELALEQLGVSGTAGYTIRDGLVYITEKYQSHEIKVYNCRDLIKLNESRTGPGVAAGLAPPVAGLGGGEGGGGIGGLGLAPGGTGFPNEGSAQSSLREVITTTIHPETWDTVGGSGSVAEFNGLLIVKHSQTVQREIKQLLDLMRAASAEQESRQ